MSEYYYHDGQDRHGPFTIEELKAKGINANTPIWKEGFTDWVKAGAIEELRPVFRSEPPPFVTSQQTKEKFQTTNVKRKNNSAAYLAIISVIVAGGLLYYFLVYNKQNESNESNQPAYNAPANKEKSADEIKEDLGTKERSNPLQYLKITNLETRINLIGETVLEGDIVCTSKIGRFKDVVIQANFYTVSNTFLSSEKFTRYEIWGDGSVIHFKFKTNSPKETKKVELQLVDAVAIE